MGVEVRARGIEDPDDGAVDPEPLLRHLADDDVRVVAVGDDDDRVRVLDPRFAQEIGVHAVADEERARPVLAEPPERILVLVDDGHVPSLGGEAFRNRRADAAATDDQCLHRRSVAPRTAPMI